MGAPLHLWREVGVEHAFEAGHETLTCYVP